MSELTVGQLRGLPVNNNVVTVPAGHTLYAPGHVLQVVQVVSTTAVNSTADAYVTSGLAATITPRFASSIILINTTFPARNAVTTSASIWTLFRGTVSTGTNLGTTAGVDAGFFQLYNASSEVRISGAINTSDLPNTVSPVTYTVAFKAGNTGNATAMFEGRKGTITLMEIAQ